LDPYNGFMHALHQRLRELDWDTFQRLIGQLLAARFPNQTIRPVDGPGGDGGLDIYEGVLDGHSSGFISASGLTMYSSGMLTFNVPRTSLANPVRASISPITGSKLRAATL
jgi:hypothetical protein